MNGTLQTQDSKSTERITVLYITCSSFSGSTLLSFLLNTHPNVVTIGHTTGWSFGEDEKFECSCGELLSECPFYQSIRKGYDAAGITFDIRDFGTAYRLSENARINDILVGCLPRLRSSGLEVMRDHLVRRIPSWTSTLQRQDHANFVIMQSALAHANAKVYVDNSHRPHRLRHLQTAGFFDLHVLHLVRDIRGVVLSHMKRRSWDAATATRVWMGEQANALRIAKEFPNRMSLHYDDLCDDLDGALGGIHEFLGLPRTPFCGDFKHSEHHILGNQMRLREGKVSRDTKWQAELSKNDLELISNTATQILEKSPNRDLAALLGRYLSSVR